MGLYARSRPGHDSSFPISRMVSSELGTHHAGQSFGNSSHQLGRCLSMQARGCLGHPHGCMGDAYLGGDSLSLEKTKNKAGTGTGQESKEFLPLFLLLCEPLNGSFPGMRVNTCFFLKLLCIGFLPFSNRSPNKYTNEHRTRSIVKLTLFLLQVLIQGEG